VYWRHFLKKILPKIEVTAPPAGVKITSLPQNRKRLLSKQQQLQQEKIIIY
jgi:hypothetical protein